MPRRPAAAPQDAATRAGLAAAIACVSGAPIADIVYRSGDRILQPHGVEETRLGRRREAIAGDLRAHARQPKCQPAADKSGVTGEKD